MFGTVGEAMEETGADVDGHLRPAARSPRAPCVEAIDAAIPLAVVITEGIPVHDTAAFWAHAQRHRQRTRIIGPNCPGIASPGQSNAGIIPADITGAGRIGLVSKSGTLTYQMMYELRDIGFSTAVGIGGDPVIGTTHIDALAAFQADPETDAIVMIGEIGGDAEERAADFIKANVTKPVVGYIAGFTAPPGKTMGHAGAIISGSSGTADGQEGRARGGRRPGRQDAERDGAADAGDRRLSAFGAASPCSLGSDAFLPRGRRRHPVGQPRDRPAAGAAAAAAGGEAHAAGAAGPGGHGHHGLGRAGVARAVLVVVGLGLRAGQLRRVDRGDRPARAGGVAARPRGADRGRHRRRSAWRRWR